MKIAIAGSNSFLAQYIIRELTARNHELVLFGVEPQPGFGAFPFHLFELPDKPPDIDIMAQCDIVIYTAGAGIHPGLNEHAELVYELNSFFPIRMVNNLISKGFLGKIITFGSYFEIGNEAEEIFYTEEEVVLSSKPASTHYATSKRVFTRFLTSCPQLPGYYHCILPNLYGKGENPDRLIPHLVNGIRQGTEIRLTVGTQVRQYIHASDVAGALNEFITKSPPPGLYNLCDRNPVQIRSLVRKVFQVLDKEDDFNRLSFGTNKREDTAMRYLLLDNKKAEQTLTFRPSVSLEEGIRSYL